MSLSKSFWRFNYENFCHLSSNAAHVYVLLSKSIFGATLSHVFLHASVMYFSSQKECTLQKFISKNYYVESSVYLDNKRSKNWKWEKKTKSPALKRFLAGAEWRFFRGQLRQKTYFASMNSTEAPISRKVVPVRRIREEILKNVRIYPNCCKSLKFGRRRW